MKVQTTILNLLLFYLAAGRVMGKTSNPYAPTATPFDLTDSDTEDEEEEELIDAQIGRLPSPVPAQDPSLFQGYAPPPPPPPPDDAWGGGFLSGLLQPFLPQGRSSNRPPPRPVTTWGSVYSQPSTYPYGPAGQQSLPQTSALPPAAMQPQPWIVTPQLHTTTSVITETVAADPITVTNYATVTLKPETSYTVITVTQPGVTSISILPASTVTAEAATVTVAGAEAASTVTQYYTYDQVTVTQFYTYPQSYVTVTEQATAASGALGGTVTVTQFAPAPPAQTVTINQSIPAPPAQTVTVTQPAPIVPARTTTVTVSAAAPACPAGGPQVSYPAQPVVPRPVTNITSPTVVTLMPPAPRPVTTQASTLTPKITPSAAVPPPGTAIPVAKTSSTSTWYCRTKCDGSWGPGRTAATAPKGQTTQKSNQQFNGYSPGASGFSAWRGINASVAVGTGVLAEAKSNASPTVARINDEIYAASHQRVPTLSRNREGQSVATPIDAKSPSLEVASSQATVIVEIPASFEGEDIPALPPADSTRLEPFNNEAGQEKKVADSNNKKQPNLNPWGPSTNVGVEEPASRQYKNAPPPVWGNQAGAPYYQQGPQPNISPWGPGTQQGPPPDQNPGAAPADPWFQQPGDPIEQEVDPCLDGLDGARPASGMCRAKQKEEEERRAREKEKEDADRRTQQQQQPQQQPQQQQGGSTWWNPFAWFGSTPPPRANTIKSNPFSKGRSKIH